MPTLTLIARAGAILLVDLSLSGDNVVLMTNALRTLSPSQRRWTLLVGITLAVALRLVAAALILFLFTFPYLEALAGLVVLYYAVLLIAEQATAPSNGAKPLKVIQGPSSPLLAGVYLAGLNTAVSVDNMFAVNAFAARDYVALAIGVTGSVVTVGVLSEVLARLFTRVRILVYVAAFVAAGASGGLVVQDRALHPALQHVWSQLGVPSWPLDLVVPLTFTFCAIINVIGLRLLQDGRRRRRG
jgi:predicted tellurium resistance membrane protein TerC